ncbi:MAG: hypothetical protein H8E44_22830 [Planctomycetes bacterium]|nr:hypothetical protein [Planctomycetota bacterium]MBL7037046.1 hypothetical protein [Pirellulaceae bacterium]
MIGTVHITPLMLTLVMVSALLATADDITVKPGDNLRAASLKLRPGDRMLLRGGVYHVMGNTIRPRTGGESWEKPITIMAYPGEQPILDGTFVLEGKWEKWKGAIHSFDLQAAGYEKPGNVVFRQGRRDLPSGRYRSQWTGPQVRDRPTGLRDAVSPDYVCRLPGRDHRS